MSGNQKLTAPLQSPLGEVEDGADEGHATALKVLIADDHPLILEGLRRAFQRENDIDVVGEAQSGTELIGMIERRRPNVVLLDLRMPGLDGTSCIERIATSWPDVKSVVMSACDDRLSIDAALHAGASAYIVKSVAAVDVASVLRQAHSGAVYHAPSAVPHGEAHVKAGEPLLTERELTILEAIANGLTTRAISRELWVSEHTVKFHLTNIYRKLGVTNRSSAVRCAVERQFAATG